QQTTLVDDHLDRLAAQVKQRHLIPPLLGIITGAILRYNPLDGEEPYALYNNLHLVTYLFLAVLIAIFLGMTNSVEEIIRDQRILLRERMLHLSHYAYFASKFATLLIFSMIQNLLFLLVSFPLLGIKELAFPYFLILTLVSATGVAIGLLISSLPNLSSKAAVNIVPIILVPQIIFGGALVKYKEMNQQLTFFSDSPIPEVCQIMPSRWGFEALATLQGSHNSFHPIENALQERLDDHRYARKEFLEAYSERLGSQEAADALFKAKGDSMQAEIDIFKQQRQSQYGNRAVQQAMQNGEFELNSLEKKAKGSTYLYPLFVEAKAIAQWKMSTVWYNALMLLLMVGGLSGASMAMLRIRFR
ncbi:MAG: ABC transporter permease, partial [Bacteroidota bacterium]